MTCRRTCGTIAPAEEGALECNRKESCEDRRLRERPRERLQILEGILFCSLRVQLRIAPTKLVAVMGNGGEEAAPGSSFLNCGQSHCSQKEQP